MSECSHEYYWISSNGVDRKSLLLDHYRFAKLSLFEPIKNTEVQAKFILSVLTETKLAFDILFDSTTNLSHKRELCLVLPAQIDPSGFQITLS